ncbi:hypothetical protein CHS0354_021592 [Potamilus streckersoni]|uniref:G-protein coupled receptors family 1 profile domain-containing protein n=1 Tax=Potamilus streckersoni TaxID=2493646 RepID=A0AAE0SPV6_9BIVA|nr:hypothetical protein CHS0354_021592 [Potamilus streckersoni]
MNDTVLFLSALVKNREGMAAENVKTWLNFSVSNLNELNSTSTSDKYQGDMCFRRNSHHKDYTQITFVLVLVITLYILVILLAVLGNVLVIWTVWRNSHMHTVTNYYIVNLAISDLLVSTLVNPLKLLEYTGDCRWQIFKADELCGFLSYLLPIFVFASILTLVAISLERYYAIVHPLSAMRINSKSRTRKIIALTWLIPMIVAFPFVFSQSYAFTIDSEYGSLSRQICNDRFDEIDVLMYGTNRRGQFRKGYFLFLFFVLYLLPVIIILTTCLRIACSLLQPIVMENTIIGRKESSRRHEENKRKVARMIIVVAFAFILSWSPQYVVSVISQLQTRSFLRESNFLFTMLMTHLCGFINSCINPFIYTAMSDKFRRSFRQIARQLMCCCSSRAIPYYQQSVTRSSHHYVFTTRRVSTDADANTIMLKDCHRNRESST